MYAKVVLFSPPFKSYTYKLPDYFPQNFWQPGLRVLMPVGKSLRCGCLETIANNCDLEDMQKCKEVVWPCEIEPVIKAELMDLAIEMGKRQGVETGAIFFHILPAPIRTEKFKIHYPVEKGKKGTLDYHKILHISDEAKRVVANLLLTGEACYIHDNKIDELKICQLLKQPPWPIRPAARIQKKILEYLHIHGDVEQNQVLSILGKNCKEAMQKLARARLIKISEIAGEEIRENAEKHNYELTMEQKSSVMELERAMHSLQPEIRLLYGITGSGKTAVYFEIAKKYLQEGKSVLLLAPEVALAYKLYLDARRDFVSCPPILYHGYQQPVLREKIFREVATAKKPILVIGTRSAIFLPIFNLNCVILDEEHDTSYKQDERLPYHTKEIARYRLAKNNGLLILGSATPDVRSFHASSRGYFPLLKLTRRASGINLPEIDILSMDKSAGLGGTPHDVSLLTPESEEALKRCIQKGEQAIILLNRRGYAPLIFCTKCAKTIRCPHCDIGMSFHKANKRLICHYCGYNLSWPAPCPECGGNDYISIGEGTEKFAERLEAMAGQPILRLDRDSARGSGNIDKVFKAFQNHEAPFLVGTQMISKGHHFPDVTLVLIADGDIGLNMPDYRATERTFQLITQAAGRAGRGEKAGKAIIQTRNPDHYCWQHVIKHDYEGFYASEISLRKKYCYPPFIKLGMLRLSHKLDDAEGANAIKEISLLLQKKAKELGIRLLGPAPAPLSMLNGRKRYQCLMKSEFWQPMRELWALAWKHKSSKNLRIILDLDPVNMM